MTTTTQTEYFVFDGPLHIAAVVCIGGLLLMLFAWSLRREQSVLGRRNTWLFGILRTIALLAVLWMVLAPAFIRSEKSETKKAVAFVVDVSPSMQTIDPPLTAEDQRWEAATTLSSLSTVSASADRALAAATLAQQRLASATAAIRSQQPERAALADASAAHDAIVRVQQNLELVVRAASDDSAAANAADALVKNASQVLQMLEGADVQQLGRLASGFRRGHDSFQTGWRESLVDLQHRLVGVRRRVAEIAHAASAVATAKPAIAKSSPGKRAVPRVERVAAFVESLEKSVLSSLQDQVDLRKGSFDARFEPFPKGGDVAKSIRESAARKTQPTEGSEQLPTTNINAPLEQLRRIRDEQPLAAVFLLTDVSHNQTDVRDPRAAAAELSQTPVYVVPIGSTEHVRDIDLKSISAPGVVMKDDEVVIEATVQAFQCAGENIRVELLHDGEVVDQRELELDSDVALQRIRFHSKLNEVGLKRFQLRVVPVEDELSQENNLGQFEVNVTRDHISVLLADELPRWEYRYLAQLFRRDPKVECDELLFQPRVQATGRRANSRAFPTTADEWDPYDVVLLGDISSQNLPVAAQQSLISYVRERGGTVVVIAGDTAMPHAYENQPLLDLLPVTKIDVSQSTQPRDGYAFHVSEEGWQHQALMIADTQDATRLAWEFINRNSPFFTLSEYRQPRATARTLIEAVPRLNAADAAAGSQATRDALLTWQPVGRGRIVYLASPETYRLRFLRGDRLHYRFWGQLLRWAIASDLASGTQMVATRTDRPDYRSGDQVEVVVRLMDETGKPVSNAELRAVATSDKESRTTVPLKADTAEPGRYVGIFEGLSTGIYRVQPEGAEIERLMAAAASQDEPVTNASFTVLAPLNRELLDTRSDRALAQQIADATGGQVLPPTAVEEVLRLTNLEPIVSESTDIRPMWVQWKFLWLVFGCLFSEWVIRKRLGLS